MRKLALVLVIAALLVGCATVPPPYAGRRMNRNLRGEFRSTRAPSPAILLLSAGVAATGIVAYRDLPDNAPDRAKNPWLILSATGIAGLLVESIWGSVRPDTTQAKP